MGRRRHYSRLGSRGKDVQSAVWLIGLGILFLTGKWWPGILILIGISMVVETLARGWSVVDTPPAPPPPAPPPPVFQTPSAVSETPAFSSRPVETPPAPRKARLPDLCPNCGAPPRTLAQRGDDPGLCPYCGALIGKLE